MHRNNFSHQRKRQGSDGFTLIELMLSMVFVAFILVFISLTLVQMMRTYDKGLAMRQISQAGSSIIEDVSQAMRSQLPTDIVKDNIDVGVFCVGDTVYRWTPMYAGPSLGALVVNGSQAAVGPDGAMMIKGTRSSSDCDTSTTLKNTSVLLTGRARVLWAGVTVVGGKSELVKLSFAIGTYDPTEISLTHPASGLMSGNHAGFYIIPHVTPAGTFSCLPGNDGNYCAFSEFNTQVYLSKDVS